MTQFKKYIRPLIVSVALALVAYLAIALALDWQKSYDALLSLTLLEWVVILGLSFINYALRAIRWCGYIDYLGDKVPYFQNMAVYFAGFAFTTTPGKVGETVRSIYLKHHGVTYRHSLAALFVERLIDVITMVILSLFTVYAFQQYQAYVAVFFVFVIGMLFAIRSPRLQNWFAARLSALGSAKFRTFGAHLIDLLQSANLLLKSKPLLIGLGLGLIAWGAEGLVLHIILASLDVDVGWPVAVGIYAIAILAGAASFIPGGLGSTEAVMGGSLILLGVDPGTAAAATLICRLVTLWPAVLIGLAFLLALEGTAMGGEHYLPDDDDAPLQTGDAQNVRE